MGYKGDAGRYSPKGIALNLFSMCVFVTPIILTTRGFQEWDWLWKVNVGMFLAGDHVSRLYVILLKQPVEGSMVLWSLPGIFKVAFGQSR